MSEKPEVRFEEAERKKSVILTSIAVVFLCWIWILRSYPILVTLVILWGIYLLTGDRYQWVYIWKKTFLRDMT